MWTPRVRSAALALSDPFLFSELVLVERYGQPDSLQITGDSRDLEPAMVPGSGVVLWDDDGNQKFSGRAVPLPGKFVEERGDGVSILNYISDLQVLWNRFCWPTPAAAWTAQTTPYDVQTAVEETRILGYILRNAGSSAYHSGANDRRVVNLRLPTTAGRGTSAKTSARFQNLGQLVADLAEAANLRVTIKQTYETGTPFLDVVIDDVPDLSAWARFGDARSGDLGMLGEDWSYGIGPGVSVVLSAAGEELENRLLNLLQDASRETDWGDRVEFFLDQRGTDDAGEIAAGMADAMLENAPTTEVQAPIVGADLEFGTGAGQVPIGAKVSVALGSGVVVDRIRQLTTTVSSTAGETTVRQEPIVGSPETGLSIEQRFLRRAGRRLTNLERR